MSNKIVLKVGGKAYSGWTEVHVSQSLDQLTGTFSFSITNPYPDMPSGWSIKLGEYCIVEIDDQVVISGYIDDMPIEYDATNHSIQISGRDRTADLVDCTFVPEYFNKEVYSFNLANGIIEYSENNIGTFDLTKGTIEWFNQTISVIIQNLCDPFGIKVVVDPTALGDISIPSVFRASFEAQRMYGADDSGMAVIGTSDNPYRANEGIAVGELIAGLCKTKAILPISYGDGNLTLTRAGKCKAQDSLILGNNIKSGHLTQSNKDRYSVYFIKSQMGGDAFKGMTDYLQPFGVSYDKGITRYRPYLEMESNINTQECQYKAEWEARRRAGRSRNVEYTVQGWTQSNGKIWELNSIVNVVDKVLGINEALLISKVDFIINDSGTNTKLTVTHPTAYELYNEAIKDIKSKDDDAYNQMVEDETLISFNPLNPFEW